MLVRAVLLPVQTVMSVLHLIADISGRLPDVCKVPATDSIASLFDHLVGAAGRNVIFQIAEVSKELFQKILRLIHGLRPRRPQRGSWRVDASSRREEWV
jgi:hypothetical protein